jgi:predicted nucleic acid-binding protein
MSNNIFLVDTSAWILALRKDFSPEVKERIDHLLKENAIITTGMVKLEILGSTKTENEFQRLKRRLDALDSVELDTSLWEKSYDLAFKLRRKGITVPYTDILIAACALKTESTVVHADAHFDLMAGHISLKMESFVTAAKTLDT